MLSDLPPAVLGDDDWMKIEEAFAPDSMFVPYLRKIRACGNVPQKAKDIFDGSLVERGHEQVNHVLRLSGLPYRLIRLGTQSNPASGDRTLAFVVLPQEYLDLLRR